MRKKKITFNMCLMTIIPQFSTTITICIFYIITRSIRISWNITASKAIGYSHFTTILLAISLSIWEVAMSFLAAWSSKYFTSFSWSILARNAISSSKSWIASTYSCSCITFSITIAIIWTWNNCSLRTICSTKLNYLFL